MYLLRWRLIYKSGKEKMGRWGKEADPEDLENMAWRQTKAGLSKALIEGKNPLTRETTVLVECDGPDFCMFQWVGKVAFKGPGAYRPFIIGLQINCRSEVVKVLNSGEIIHEAKPLPDKHFHFGRQN